MVRRKISLRQYPNLSVTVPNPVNLKKLPKGKTFQINHPKFVLQFFFNGRDVYGVIFKRDRMHPIRMRWCFFRSCEESTFDYKVTIAEKLQSPFEGNFFRIDFPRHVRYEFQGLDFSDK